MTTVAQVVDAARGFASTAGMTNPSVNPVWLAVFTLLKKSDSSSVTVGACFGTPAWNGSGAPAGVQFRVGLLVPTITQTILRNGEPGRSSVSTRGVLALVNDDGYWSGKTPGQTIDYLDPDAYEWQSVVLWLGVNPDAYGDFNRIDGYRIEGRPRTVDGLVELRPAGALLDDTKPAYDAKYLGIDVGLDSDDGTLHCESGNSDTNVALAEDFRLCLWFNVPATASAMTLASNRVASTGTTAGWSLGLAAGGGLEFSMGDGAAEFAISDATARDTGVLFCVQVWGDRDTNLLKGEVSTDGGAASAFSTDEVDISAMVAVTNAIKMRTHENTGGANPTTGLVTELYFATGSGIGYPADLRQQHRQGPSSIRDTGAQYHWPMNEDEGTVVKNALDAKTGEQVEVPKTHAVTGSLSTREINFGNNYDKNDTDSFTLMVWFRSLASGSIEGLVGKKAGEGAASTGYLMSFDASDNLYSRISDGATQATAGGAAVKADGVWRCYAMTVERGSVEELKTWVSDSSGTVWAQLGATSDTTSVGSPSNALSLYAGEINGATNPANGDFGPIAMYSSALTAAKLAKLAPIHPTQADESTLQSYWPVDEGTGTTIADAVVASAVDGTMGAGGSWVKRDGAVTVGTSHNATGDKVWVSTQTGGYADIYSLRGGGGTSKGQGFGLVRRAKVVWQDNRGHYYAGVDAALTDAVIGQFHDSDDAVQSVEAVEEDGVVASEVDGDFGDYYIDLANGRLYWRVDGGFPVGDITVTFKGAKFNGGVYSDRLGLSTREWLTANSHLTAGELPAASATDFDPDFPHPVGIYIPGGLARPRTVRQQLTEDFPAPGLFTSTDLTGATFHFMRSLVDPDDYTADITLTDKVLASIPQQLTPPKPVRQVSVGYAKDQASGDYEWAVVTSSTVTDADGRDLTLKTPLQNHADAMAWGQLVLTKMADPLLIEVSLNRHFWAVFLARAGRNYPDVVSLQSDYASVVSSAKNFLVYGVRYGAPRSSGEWEIALQLGRFD